MKDLILAVTMFLMAAIMVLTVIYLKVTDREPPVDREISLSDAVPLRKLPGSDGCIPGTHTPPFTVDGVTFPGTCESANSMYYVIEDGDQ